MNSSQRVMVSDKLEVNFSELSLSKVNFSELSLSKVNLSELSLSKVNLSECGIVGEGESCAVCTTIDYWVEGPVIFAVCLAGILGHTYNKFTQNIPSCQTKKPFLLMG